MKSKIALIAIIILAAVLRLYALDQFPNGLNADEAAIGYNAYSLIQTGHDEHGVSWPSVFRSFDDYKPPVYFYLVLPFVKILGLNVWAVRLPSAILGIATVYLLYLLTNQILKNKNLALIAAGLLAISPWHLQFSRGGWEVNTATFFLILGLWAFFKSLNHPKYFFLWILSHVLSLYTYHSMRVVAPLLDIYLLIAYLPLKAAGPLEEGRPTQWRWGLCSLLFGFILCLPLASQMLSSAGQSRFAGVSIFADQGPVLQANVARGQHSDPQALFVKVLHNRYYNYFTRFISNLAKHYSVSFLFLSGDEIGRSRIPGFGQSYLWTLPFFAFGLWFLAKNLNKKTSLPAESAGLILYWFIIGSFAAALTFQSPHALRAQNISLPFQIIIALGLYQAYLWLSMIFPPKLGGKARSARVVLTLIISVAAIAGLIRYLNSYYYRYPREIPYAWQPGFQELGNYLKQNGDQYDQIIISTRYDQPYILVAFFTQYPPAKFQSELVFSTPDQYGFSTGLSFHNYHFRPINFAADSQLKNTLLVVADEKTENVKIKSLFTINYPNGDPIFRLFQTQP